MGKQVTYRYHAYSRPPWDDCIPHGYANKEVHSAPRKHRKKNWYGFVEYQWKLSLHTLWRYELFPDDEVEAATYVFYQEADLDVSEMNTMIADYTSRPIEELQKEAKKDVLAAAAIVIMENKNETPNPVPTPAMAPTYLTRF